MWERKEKKKKKHWELIQNTVISLKILGLAEYLSLRIIEISRNCNHSILCWVPQVVFWREKKKRRQNRVIFKVKRIPPTLPFCLKPYSWTDNGTQDSWSRTCCFLGRCRGSFAETKSFPITRSSVWISISNAPPHFSQLLDATEEWESELNLPF